MNKQIEQVLEFHKAFNCPIGEKGTMPDNSLTSLRGTLLWEEAKESWDELESWKMIPNNIDKIAKEHADLLYILLGNIITFGLQDKFEEVFNEVHRSNMSKLEEGKPVYRDDGKVIKGKDYTPANIEQVLNN